MYAHLVPETFLYQWRISGFDNAIFEFKKNNNNAIGTHRNISNVAGKGSYYYLPFFSYRKVGDNETDSTNYLIETYQKCFPSFFDIIYTEILSKFTYKKDGCFVTKKESTIDLLKDINIDGFELYDLSGQQVSIKKNIINKVNEKWKDLKYREFIEIELGKIETGWRTIIERIINDIQNRGQKSFIVDVAHFELMQFISIQRMRDEREPNFQEALRLATGIVEEAVNEFTPFEFSEIDKTNFWRNQVLLYFSGNKNNSITSILNSKKNASLYIICADKIEFITSDFPVVVNWQKGKAFEFFPFSPKYCFCIANRVKETKPPRMLTHELFFATDKIVKYINHLSYQLANESVYFNKDSFEMDSYFPRDDFFEMFRQQSYWSPIIIG